KVAYCDPPYIGQANKYPEKREVDHKELIDRMNKKYDCWALSASSPSLQYILSLCPADVRVGAWVKPFCIFKPNVNPAYAWEPVIFRGERKKRSRQEPTVRDWVSANITLKKGIVGAKPPEFCGWLFELLGLTPEDELHDLYPGTGIVTACWEQYKAYKLSLSHSKGGEPC
ncbi:hypothetical protein LCGC14_1624680, partial [marine sediment metagenome]